MTPQSPSDQNIPNGGYSVIYIPINKSTNKFSRTVYTPKMTEEKITSEELNQVLNDLELVTKKLPTNLSNILTIIDLFVLPLIAFVMLMESWYCSYYDHSTDSYRRTERSWTPLFIYYFIALPYYNLSKKYQPVKIKAQTDSIVQMYQSQFNQKGYRLFIPFNFPDWIEIHKDSHLQQMPVPKVNHFEIPQTLSQILQSPTMQKTRQYVAFALQSLASAIQNSQNSQGLQAPLNNEQNKKHS